MSDEFALVPRAFADRFFSAIEAFYACDGSSWPPSESWWRADCNGEDFEESVLFRYLHAMEIPYRVYPMFDYTTISTKDGGNCSLDKGTYSTACILLGTSDLLPPSFSR